VCARCLSLSPPLRHSVVLVYRRKRLLCSRHCVDLNNAICCSPAFRSSLTQHVTPRVRSPPLPLHIVSSAVGTASTSIMRFVAGRPFSVRQTSYFIDGFKFVVNSPFIVALTWFFPFPLLRGRTNGLRTEVDTWEYKDMRWPDLMSLPLPVSLLLLSVLRPSPCPKRPSTYF
jgi:hypothetical protein